MGPKTRGKAFSGSDFIRNFSPIAEITGLKLPSRGQVVRRMFYRRQNLKENVRESSRAVIEEVYQFWGKAHIPTQLEKHCIVKLEKLYSEWELIKKHSVDRKTRLAQQEREKAFIQTKDNLFDIAHAEALLIIKNEEDKQFLINQRLPGPVGTMGAKDTVLASKVSRLAQRKCKEDLRKEKSEGEKTQQFSAIDTSPIISEESLSGSEKNTDVVCSAKPAVNFEDLPSTSQDEKCVNPELDQQGIRPRGVKTILSPDLCAALDRVQLTDRNAMHVIIAVLKSLGVDPSGYIINRTSIRLERMHFREELALNLKEDIVFSGVLTVHWDGKLLPDLTGNTHVDRLPIIISGGGKTELLGIPKIPRGTGEAQANVVFEHLKDYNIDGRVSAMSFDTTATNTGPNIGACVLLESLLQRELLWLPCRRHIAELLLGAAYESLFGKSSAPTVPLFERFRSAFPKFESTAFDDSMVDPAILSALSSEEKDTIISFLNDQISDVQPRDDYLEFLQLTLALLGEKTFEYFKAPGGVSHARWMSKALYCMKIWLFRHKFKLSKRETNVLPQFCTFIVRAYVEYWFQVSLPLCAARIDLAMIRKLCLFASECKSKNSNPYLAAAAKIKNHISYLSEEQIGLAFFDSGIPAAEKRLMVESYKNRCGGSVRITRLTVSSVNHLNESNVQDFVSQNTAAFFEMTGLSDAFMEYDPDEWGNIKEYQNGRALLKSLQVVNDCAERGVALIEQCNKKLTKNEEQLQFLVKTIAEHRKRFPNTLKNSIAGS